MYIYKFSYFNPIVDLWSNVPLTIRPFVQVIILTLSRLTSVNIIYLVFGDKFKFRSHDILTTIFDIVA